MRARGTARIAVTGVALAACLAGALPARAAVRYDEGAKTGYVSGADVRKAFGWDEGTLAAKAKGLTFGHEFWSDDTYRVRCGGAAFPVVHHRDFGRWDLTDAVAFRAYGKKVEGFRLLGAHSGISGTSVAPAPGQPCPRQQGERPGATIRKAALVSSTTGWALFADSGTDRRELLRGA